MEKFLNSVYIPSDLTAVPGLYGSGGGDTAYNTAIAESPKNNPMRYRYADVVRSIQNDNDQVQSLFERIVKHLLKQGQSAVNSAGTCKYLSDDGKKCAVGALISDHLYNLDLEGRPYYDQLVLHAVEKSLGTRVTDRMFTLLGLMQEVHDKNTSTADDSYRSAVLRGAAHVAALMGLTVQFPID